MFSLFLFVMFDLNSILCSPAAIPWHIECKYDDDACVTKAVQAAYPLMLEPNTNIGAEEMDPMYQELIEKKLEILDFEFYNTTITGFKTCKVNNAKFNETPDSIKVELFCKKFTLKGQYDLVVRLLILITNGSGDFFIETGEYNIIVDLVLETLVKDGMIFRTITSFSAQAEALAPVKYDFQGLTYESKIAEDEIHKYIDDNWKEIAGVPSLTVLYPNLKKIIRNTNKYLEAYPFDHTRRDDPQVPTPTNTK